MTAQGNHPLSRTALLAVVGGIALFTAYATLSRYNLDRYGDMLENYGWGIGWQLGYLKHPPLFGWITAAYFQIAPRTDAAYYLLAALNAGAAVLLVLMASTRFLDDRRQVALVIIAYMIPAFGFMAIKYNANSAMLPFWAGCILFYIRLLEARRIGDAVALGLFGGLAMLAKYHSVVLILSIALFTLWDREARALLRTPLPWIASLVAILVFLPHFLWLVDNDFITITYAADQGEASFLGLMSSFGLFVGAFVSRLVLAVLFLFLFWRRPDGFPFNVPEAFSRIASLPAGRAVLATAVGPGLLTIMLGLALGTPLTETWSIPCAVPYPILFAVAVPPAVLAARWRLVRALVAVLSVMAVAAAPVVRSERFGHVSFYGDFPVREAVTEIERWYRETSRHPLAIAGGEPVLAYGMAFYGTRGIRAVAGSDLTRFPWVDADDVARSGAVYVCVNRGRPACLAGARKFLVEADDETEFVVGPVDGIRGARPFKVRVFARRPSAP